MHGKNAMMRSSGPIVSKIVLSCLVLSCLVILSFYMIKQIDNVVCLPEIILNIVTFGRDAELYKLVLERSALLEKAMYLALDFHFRLSPLLKTLSAFIAGGGRVLPARVCNTEGFLSGSSACLFRA